MSLFRELLIDSLGQSLFVSTDRGLSKYEVATGELVNFIETPVIAAHDPEGHKSKTKTAHADFVNLRFLKQSSDGAILASVLDDAKAVLVLDSQSLKVITTFVFPKRPCSIDFIDSRRLIVGDKFGDVYEVEVDSLEPNNSVVQVTQKPLLGHVSMLVDVVYSQHNDYKAIISADRDEHIRVTRYPQTFIIDRWLFGHTEFVSSVVTVPWMFNLLVSGGGDNQIILWDWTTGAKLSAFKLTKENVQDSSFPEEELAVKKLYILSESRQVLVSFEKTPFLVLLSIREASGGYSLEHNATLKLSIQLEVLDVSVHESQTEGAGLQQLVAVAYKDPTLLLKLYKLESNQLNGTTFGVSEQEIRSLQDHSLETLESRAVYPLQSLRKRAEH